MFSYSTAMTVYDSLGNKQQLTAYFGKTGTTNAGGGNDWNMNVTDAAGNILSTITISFNANGTMTGTTPANPTVTLPAANGAAAMTAAVNLTGSTQFGSDNDPKSIVQNGFASGALVGYAVQEDGTILGSYSNEQTLSLGQIAMASFGNVEGLKPQGDNVWSATGASGQELLGVAGGAMGTLKSNAVEESNVDLSGQLVNLIVAQRNYQANAQTIKAQDTVLQTLVNI
jgi:flagellar hook protein FlgE